MAKQIVDDGLWKNICGYERTHLPADLYLWWAIFSDFRVSHPLNGAFPTTISFIAERAVDKNSIDFSTLRLAKPAVINPVYTELTDRAPSQPTRFFTFTIEVPFLPFIDARTREVNSAELEAALLTVFTHKGFKRLQLGFPRGRFANENQDSTASPPSPLREEASVPAQSVADVVIGVVDNGAAFAHGSLRDSTGLQTRLVTVWNQSRVQPIKSLNGKYWRRALRGWYGAVLPQAEMNNAMKDSERHGEVDELTCYESLYLDRESQRVLNNRDVHGAAVLTCVAGAFNPMWMIKTSSDANAPTRPRRVKDAASRAPVIFVDVPFETATVSSGRWMPLAALDAVRFILDEAQRRYCKKLATPDTPAQPVPVVINISSGSNAGSRDGQSMFESALTELLEACPTLSVAVATGNARLSSAHAVRLVAAGKTGELVVRVPAAKRGETYVEFWPEWEEALMGEPFAAHAAGLKFSLVTPNGTEIIVGNSDTNGALLKSGENVVAGLNYVFNAVQSQGRPMALLVIAATAPLQQLPYAPYGNWTVKCENKTGRTVRIKAWIERDEIVSGIRRPQFAHFCETSNVPPPKNDWVDIAGISVSRYDTSSNLANAKGTFSVAASMGPRDDGYVSPYSGGGSAVSGARPSLIARADRSSAKPGVPVFGSYGSARQHMNGTSIAAPQAARWIANYVAQGCDRSSIQLLAQYSVPRNHPHLKDNETGREWVAASEGRWFIDPWDESSKLCLGESK